MTRTPPLVTPGERAALRKLRLNPQNQQVRREAREWCGESLIVLDSTDAGMVTDSFCEDYEFTWGVLMTWESLSREQAADELRNFVALYCRLQEPLSALPAAALVSDEDIPAKNALIEVLNDAAEAVIESAADAGSTKSLRLEFTPYNGVTIQARSSLGGGVGVGRLLDGDDVDEPFGLRLLNAMQQLEETPEGDEPKPLLGEADPEFEKLLEEEEAIERSVREHHETPTTTAQPKDQQ